MEKPAILGGPPITKRPIPFTKIIIGEEESEAVREVITSRRFVGGKYTRILEKEFARYIGVKHAIAVSNGTDGLFLANLALDLTFGKEIATTPLTFISTASAIVHTGAIPIFVDVLPDGNINPDELSRLDRCDGITIVHLYGNPVEFNEIRQYAEEQGVPIIEDASHAHGAEYRGYKVGKLGDIAVFSLYPSKVIAAGGWGGIITTNSDEIAEKIRLLQAHGELKVLEGAKRAYEYIRLGYNMRISEIEAAIACCQLKKLDKFIEQRRRAAKIMREMLENIPGITPPEEKPYKKHAYYIFNISVDPNAIGWDRDAFVNALNAEGIMARKGYHIPLHKTKLFSNINDPQINHFAKILRYPNYSKITLPLAEKLAKNSIWLPMYPGLDSEEIELIILAIKKLINWRKKIN